jgi:GNAT superfamily N-acetyltransferase
MIKYQPAPMYRYDYTLCHPNHPKCSIKYHLRIPGEKHTCNPQGMLIGSLFVEEAHRRQGIATSLLQRCLMIREAHGIPAILYVDKGNYLTDFLKPFYEKHGFRSETDPAKIAQFGLLFDEEKEYCMICDQ